MSAEKNIEDNTSKEVLSDRSKTIQGDIYVQDVHKYFGVTKALNGVNFNANFGEIHAIVGGNGCGKSTLAKAMSGVLPEIMPREKLQEGNAVIGLMTNFGYIIGTLTGGILVATVGAGWGLLVDAITFFIAGVIVWFLPIMGRAKEQSPGILHDLIVGWKEFIS